ncbi:MAG: endonuclease III [Acidobacteriota bacterium]|nr:endonuclease III [Acidobacteriota bacterium]
MATPKKMATPKRKSAGAAPRASVPASSKVATVRKSTAPERVTAILDELQRLYPDVQCALNHRNAWELTVATILSAQCTDVRVNLVTPALFRAFPTPRAMATASLPELEELVRTTGFFRNKAKNIRGAAQVVTEKFGGKVPQTMEEMLQLPGVARKTANVVLGSWYGIASGVVVDTHVLRISRRLGLTRQTTPEKVEADLKRLLPQQRWVQFSHEVIHHGRAVCVARKPRCAECTLEPLCQAKDKTWHSA